MGLKAFRHIQVSNVEGTVGSAEAAVEIFYGMGKFDAGVTIHQPVEDRNSLALNVASDVVVGKEAHLTLTGDVNFRHALWLLAMSICGNVTPTQPSTSLQPLAYLWTFDPTLTAANTPDITAGIDTFTFEVGDDTQNFEAEYCFATKLEISGAPNEACKFTASITGRQWSKTTKTAALVAAAVQYAPFNLAKFYLDTSGAGMGGTQVTGLLKGFTWTLDTKFKPLYCPDGELYFSGVVEGAKGPELKLTYAWGDAALAEQAYYLARTKRFARVALRGTTEIDTGQSNVPYLYLDQCIQYATWPEWGDSDGLTTFEVTCKPVYDATWAKIFRALLLTTLSAYPT